LQDEKLQLQRPKALKLQTVTLNQSQQNHDNRNYKQNVNQTTHGVGRDESQHPQNDQDDCNCS